jgi:hypothetical protein
MPSVTRRKWIRVFMVVAVAVVAEAALEALAPVGAAGNRRRLCRPGPIRSDYPFEHP